MSIPTHSDSQFTEDPLYRHSLREAAFILSLWACCLVYTVGYCYLYGYLTHEPATNSTGPGIDQWVGPLTSFNRDPESITYPLGLGIPDWVFYGVVLPWCVCVAATFWYLRYFFADDDLSPSSDRETTEGESLE